VGLNFEVININTQRLLKINYEIKICLSEIFEKELRDPRLDILFGVSRVKTSSDLSNCLVYISLINNSCESKKNKLVKILNHAASYIRVLVAKKINLRMTPVFKFILDDSCEYSARIENILEKIKIS